MMSREPSNKGNIPTTQSLTFSEAELARLAALRQSFHTSPEFLPRVMNERRLEFARWLAENGKLDEFSEPAE